MTMADIPDWLPQFAIVAIFLMFIVGMQVSQQRRQAALNETMRESRESLRRTHDFQEATRERSDANQERLKENADRAARALELAEQAARDRREMIALLGRIAEALEARR